MAGLEDLEEIRRQFDQVLTNALLSVVCLYVGIVCCLQSSSA